MSEFYKGFYTESYEEDQGRCWGCCQENCGHCSCSCHTATETRYRVVKAGKPVEGGFRSPPNLKEWFKRTLDLRETRKRFAARRTELKTDLRLLKEKENAEVKRIQELRK